MPVDLANITAPDLLSALETAGRAPSLNLIHTAMSRRHDLTAGLLDLLATPPDENWQAQDPRRYAQIHAGHLLIFYREPQAIPIFMRLLRVAGDETAVEWFEQALASYGMGILPELAALINDSSAPVSARLGVTTTLRQLVAEFPTDRAKVIQVLRGALPSLNKKGKPVLPRPRPPKPNLLWTHVSIALVELTDHASRTTIEALFREKWLDPSVLGPFEAYLDRLQNPVPFRSETFNIIERYERLAHESDAQEWDNRSMQDLRAQLHNLNAPASENAGSSASPDLSPAPASASHSAAEADAPIALPQTGTPVGSNDPCPCGSGRKYKHCHGKI